MKAVARLLLVCLVAVALPLQVLASVTRQHCQPVAAGVPVGGHGHGLHAHGGAAEVGDAGHGDGHHGHHGHQGHHGAHAADAGTPGDAAAPDALDDRPGCSACAACAGLAPMSTWQDLPVAAPRAEAARWTAQAFVAVPPEHPERPPRSASR